MAHPQASSRSLQFFLDLGNLSGSVRGGTVILPPNNQEYWESKGPGTFFGFEWTIYNAGATEVDEQGVPQGSLYWDSEVLGLEEGPKPIYGYKVSVRGYQDVITQTPIPGPPDPITGEPTIEGYTWANTRTYPVTTKIDCKFSNSQKRIPPLWPRPDNTKTPEMQEWEEIAGEAYSTVIAPRQFEGVALYGNDQLTTTETEPVIVGIAQGAPVCRGFVENKDVVTVDSLPVDDYYIAVDTSVAYIRTPDDRIQPLVNNNDNDIPGHCVPFRPDGLITGRVNHPDELPKVAGLGVTYVQIEPNPPFAGFVGRHVWAYTGVEYADENGNRIRDRNGNEIPDFRWQRSTKPQVVSGYIYPLVFDQAVFEYIERLSGPNRDDISIKNPAATGGWFPSEPYDPNATPPVYPYDTIPAFVPDGREMIDVDYGVSISGNVGTGGLISESIDISQTCIAPTLNWESALTSLLERSYYYNGISRSYATKPGYCNPSSPNYGDNATDPYCVTTEAFGASVSTPNPTVTKPSPTPIATPPN